MSRVSAAIPRVKLVAIAKDESPYLAEWIHHHLYFGFSSIDVLVNRTSDCSYDVLDNIAKKYPCVNYRSIDWIDMAGPDASRRMQAIGYALLMQESRIKKECTHLVFLDVDEFWVPLDMRTSISECIVELGSPEVLSFEWGNSIFENGEYSLLSDELTLWVSGMVKSSISVDAKVNQLRLHVPIVENCNNHLLANGATFSPSESNPQSLHPEKRSVKKYFILHRMYRSEKEYIANLMKGNPEDHNKIKLNRRGYNTHGDMVEKIKLELSMVNLYRDSYLDFIENCSLSGLMDISIERRKLDYELFFKLLPISYMDDPKKVEKVLVGITDSRVDKALGSLREVVDRVEIEINSQCGNNRDAGAVRDLAIGYERKNEFLSAYYAMRQARGLNYKGPLINKKLKHYYNTLIDDRLLV